LNEKILKDKSYIGWKVGSKGFEVTEIIAKFYIRIIHQNGQDSLGCTCIINNLLCEEDMIICIILAIWMWHRGLSALPLE
jgi:hypothetical protein